MSAPAGVSVQAWRSARRALIVMGVVLIAMVAALVTLLVVRPSAASAPQPAAHLHAVDDTCLGARPGSAC